jgi:hypothetical protein
MALVDQHRRCLTDHSNQRPEVRAETMARALRLNRALVAPDELE